MSDEERFRQLVIGSVCKQLICQQYWFEGRCSDEANVLFMQTGRGKWLRFLFDCGEFFWRMEATPSLPEEAQMTGQYAYPIVDLTGRCGVADHQVVDLSFYELPRGRGLKVVFSEGKALIVENSDDRNTLRCDISLSA